MNKGGSKDKRRTKGREGLSWKQSLLSFVVCVLRRKEEGKMWIMKEVMIGRRRKTERKWE